MLRTHKHFFLFSSNDFPFFHFVPASVPILVKFVHSVCSQAVVQPEHVINHNTIGLLEKNEGTFNNPFSYHPLSSLSLAIWSNFFLLSATHPFYQCHWNTTCRLDPRHERTPRWQCGCPESSKHAMLRRQWVLAYPVLPPQPLWQKACSILRTQITLQHL